MVLFAFTSLLRVENGSFLALTGLIVSLMFLVKASRHCLWCHWMQISQPIQECFQGLKLEGASAAIWDLEIVKYFRHLYWPSPKSMPCIVSVAVRFVTSRIKTQECLYWLGWADEQAQGIISIASPEIHLLSTAVEGDFIPRLVYVIRVQHVYHVSCQRGQSDRGVDGIGKTHAESFPLVQLIFNN